MKTLTPTLSLIVGSATSAFAATYFLPGVSLESGWHDAEKVWKDSAGNNVDDQMCWAAQVSNMAQYWQDWYVKAGNKLPEGTPNGYGNAVRNDGIPTSKIFDAYKSAWTNVAGVGLFGLPWYFTGSAHPDYYKHRYYERKGYSHLTGSGGGYFSELYSGANDFIQKETFLEHLEYDGGLSIQEFTEKMKHYIIKEPSVIGLSIDFWNPHHAGGHAVTLWGFDLDESTDWVSAIYITDSDDDYYGIKRYELETYWNGADIEMETYLGEAFRDEYNCTFDRFTSLSVSRFVAAIPEPSAFGLLAGAGTLALAFLRRRKRA